jgi:hypothetical protein
MKQSQKGIFIVVMVCMLICAVAAEAQIMGLPIPPHALEIGYTHKWFHRDVETGPVDELKWEVGTIAVRYGALSRLTISFEGNTSLYKNDDFPGLEFERYTVGGGVVVEVWERGPWNLSTCLHYNEVYDHDISKTHFHKRVYDIIGGVQAGYCFEPLGQRMNVWAGPMVVRDVGENYPWDANEPIRSESSGDFGFAVGSELVAVNYIAGNFYVVYADYLQARIRIAFHIGGAE